MKKLFVTILSLALISCSNVASNNENEIDYSFVIERTWEHNFTYYIEYSMNDRGSTILSWHSEKERYDYISFLEESGNLTWKRNY